MSTFLIALLSVISVFGTISLFCHTTIDEHKHLRDFNLYEIIGTLPIYIIGWVCFGLFRLIKLTVKTNYVQAFHKFMLKKPSDLINFRITIEKRS